MDMKKRFLHLFSLMLAVLMLIPCVGRRKRQKRWITA